MARASLVSSALGAHSSLQRIAHLQRIGFRIPTVSHISVAHESTARPVKARVLEQPDKFRPPSHPAKLRTKPRAYPGPPLSEQERERQKTKKYPHMMPPEGSLMHRFLTTRWLHAWITMSVLVALTFWALVADFFNKTPFKDDLPPNNLFLSHPIQFVSRWIEIYSMHTEHITQQTIAKREAKSDDIRKRSQYRKAHGIDEESGFGGFTFGRGEDQDQSKDVVAAASREGGDAGAVQAESVSSGEYVDFTGERRKVKKWLGIW